MTALDASAADRFVRLLDAEIARRDRVVPLRASRVVVRVGDGEVEILEPDGTGPVADHLASGRGGPFAAGFATRTIHRLRRQLAERGIVPTNIGLEQHFIDGRRLGIPGLNVVISPDVDRPRVGLLTNLYEVTHLTATPDAAADMLEQTFALDASGFVPIESDNYGYRGVLTLFQPDRLHRIETIHPFDGDKTMGRFFSRYGPRLHVLRRNRSIARTAQATRVSCTEGLDRKQLERRRTLRASQGAWRRHARRQPQHVRVELVGAPRARQSALTSATARFLSCTREK
jgi:hypothetical protein